MACCGACSRGVALVVVLWLIAALTVLVGAGIHGSRIDIRLVQHQRDEVQAQALCDGAIRLAAAELSSPAASVQGRALQREYLIDATAIRVAVTPATGLIDLNRAPLSLLQDMLIYGAGLEAAAAANLAARIVDWRDPDEEPLPGGAERADYVATGVSTGPRNGPFILSEDLRQVLGMSAEIYARLQRLVTVHGGSAVDPDVAPPEVLLILARGNRGQAQHVQEQREQGYPIPLEQFPSGHAGRGNAVMFRYDAVAPADEQSHWRRTSWIALGESRPQHLPWRILSSEPMARHRDMES